jgi:hypothetical protein
MKHQQASLAPEAALYGGIGLKLWYLAYYGVTNPYDNLQNSLCFL